MSFGPRRFADGAQPGTVDPRRRPREEKTTALWFRRVSPTLAGGRRAAASGRRRRARMTQEAGDGHLTAGRRRLYSINSIEIEMKVSSRGLYALKALTHLAEAYAALSQADASAGMGPTDLELLAIAAHLMGHVRDSIGALQRAYQLYIDAGEVDQGVRCAFLLGYHLINSGDFGQAVCWLARVGRVVDDLGEETAAIGYVLLPRALLQAAIVGD